MFRKIKLKIIPIFLIYQNVFIGPEFLWMTRAHGNIYYKQKAGEFSTINFPSKPLKPQRQLTVWELWSVGICGKAGGVDCACGGHSRMKQCIKRRPMFRKWAVQVFPNNTGKFSCKRKWHAARSEVESMAALLQMLVLLETSKGNLARKEGQQTLYRLWKCDMKKETSWSSAAAEWPSFYWKLWFQLPTLCCPNIGADTVTGFYCLNGGSSAFKDWGVSENSSFGLNIPTISEKRSYQSSDLLLSVATVGLYFLKDRNKIHVPHRQHYIASSWLHKDG